MRTRTAVTFAALVALSSQVAMSAEKLESCKIEIDSGPTVERVWQHRGSKLGAFRGTFDGISTNRAFIIDPWGERLEIPLFSFSAPDLSHIMNRLAKFPEHADEYTLTPGRRKLIDVSADDLRPGKLTEWKNRGVLGGTFHSMHVPPMVEEFKGRKAVKFNVWEGAHIDINYQIMTGDFCVNDYLGANKPFTLTAWVYKNSLVEEDESTILSWHAIAGDYGTRVSFAGRSDVAGLSRAATSDIKRQDDWQHAAFVYTGGEDGKLLYYRNGILASESTWDNLIEPISVGQITATSAVVRASLRAKKGRASVGLYIGEQDHHLWYQQRHWHWDQELTQYDAPAGELRFEIRDLKPGTTYYFRMHAIDTPGFWWSYGLNDLRRWNHGRWSLVTAGEDGMPGRLLPKRAGSIRS